MSKAFDRLPDRTLMPWLPQLIMMLRPHAATVLPALMKEAAGIFPSSLAALDAWQPPWDRSPSTATAGPAEPATTLSAELIRVQHMLADHPSCTNALATALGVSRTWKTPADATGSAVVTGNDTASGDAQVAQLLDEYPATLAALAKLLCDDPSDS